MTSAAILPDDRIAHLLFSTRHARPETSSGYNREIVAESPGVPPGARREFDSLADMTGFILRKPDLPPLWAFRRVDADHWLLVRAVSQGFYRKGHHQLLAHGVVLRRHHLDWLDANPFLLATPEAREAGFRFEEEHPEGKPEPPPLRLDVGFAAVAPRLNRSRFQSLTADFAPPEAHDLAVAFPALYESSIDRQRCTAFVPPGRLDAERPDPRFLEWLLLHFHPADRAELSFHGWYAYDSPRPFDLVGVARSDADELRRHLQGEVEIWDAGRPTDPAPLGERVQALRQSDPLHFSQALETYYLTLLEPRFRPDPRGKSLPTLSPDEALLCLRRELEEPLDDQERRVERRLRSRGGSELEHKAIQLAAAWEDGADAFAAAWSRFREVPVKASSQNRDAALGSASAPVERWSLLALLPHAEPPPSREELRQAWGRLVRPGRFPELLSLFHDPHRVRLAEEGLLPWMEAEAAAGPASSGAGDGTADWALYLRFLHHHDRPVLAAARRLEEALDGAAPDAALAGYRELQKVCFEAGLPPFAFRLLFQKEVPRLPEPARRIRVADGVRRLLDSDGEGDEVLGPALAGPVEAEAVFQTLARWMEERPPGEGWPRCRSLLSHQRRPLPPQAVDAAAAFLATLAGTPGAVAEGLEHLGRETDLRDRLWTATARALVRRLPPAGGSGHLFRNVGLLLDLRNETPGLGEAADRALLDLARDTLVLGPPPAAGEILRRHFATWLQVLLDEGRFPRLLERPGEWRHLLLDELLLAPAGEGDDPAADPRLRAYQLLAWQRWRDARDEGSRRAARVGLLRGTAPLGGAAERRRCLEATLPDGWRERATPDLDLLFPGGVPHRDIRPSGADRMERP